jgi:pimeloyl-ACP methyl ester carboxylesterase
MIEQRALMDELPAVAAVLGSVGVPVEVVSGDWDLVVPPRAAVTLARSIPRSQLTMVPRAGHFVARDAPETLAAVIRRSAGPGSVEDPTVS